MNTTIDDTFTFPAQPYPTTGVEFDDFYLPTHLDLELCVPEVYTNKICYET